MKLSFYLIRFFIILAGSFVIIVGVQFFKSQNIIFALTQGAIWSPITAAVYISALVYKLRRSSACCVRGNTKN